MIIPILPLLNVEQCVAICSNNVIHVTFAAWKEIFASSFIPLSSYYTLRSMKLKVGILVSPCPSVRLRIILHVILRIMAGMRRIGNAEIFSTLWLKCGYNAEISPYSCANTPIRIFSAFPPHSFPYKNAEISPRSCPNTPIRIFSAFPPHFFPYNAEISSHSCPNTPIRIFSARKMQKSGVQGLKKSTLVPVRAWCQKDGKPLPQPKFTKIPDVIWHHLATISLLISPLVPHYRGGRSWRELTHWGLVAEIWVTIGSGNGLLPDGTKPLPEPMLTYQ